MRRFIVVAPGCSGPDLAAWEDVGFKVETTAKHSPGEQPDAMFFWSCSQENISTNWRLVNQLRPKMFVIADNCEQKINMPGGLLEIYDTQVIAGEDVYFTIGSSIQGKIAVPDWPAHRLDGRLSREVQIKAVAGSVYRYLLEDVFRETAEWCGHMSSVVGPM